MRLRKRSTARSRGAALVSESRRDRRALARDAGLGRVSVVSLLGGVAAAVAAFTVLIGAAAAATSAANFDTDLMSQEWRKLDASDAAILSAALFLACVCSPVARAQDAAAAFERYRMGDYEGAIATGEAAKTGEAGKAIQS